MDGNTQIGVVNSFIVKSTDQLGNEMETTLNKKLLANQEATYQNVDTANRALFELSLNTYQDTICVTNISVAEVLAG